MKNLRPREVKWLAQGHTLLMMSWKNNSGWGYFAFVPLSPVDAVRQKTGLKDQISTGKTSEGQGHTTEHTGSQGDSRVLASQGVPPGGTGFPNASRSKLLDWQSCPMKGPWNILRNTGGNYRAPFHELPSRGSWNSHRETSQPLKNGLGWQKMKLSDTEATETVLSGGPSFSLFPTHPHNPSQQESPWMWKEVGPPLLNIIWGGKSRDAGLFMIGTHPETHINLQRQHDKDEREKLWVGTCDNCKNA